jgi:hypothetical protein
MSTSTDNNAPLGIGISNELQALLGAVRTAMPGAPIPPLSTAAGRGALYEWYVWCLTWQTAVLAGADDPPTFCTRNGVPATPPYTFRLGPGRLEANDPFTYAVLTFTWRRPPKQPLEVHLGIYICGPSGEPVQSDVCVMWQEEADYFRTRQMRTRRSKLTRYWPDAARVWLTIECKFLKRNMSSRIVHEVIGRLAELPAKNHALIVNTQSRTAGQRVIACFGSASWQNLVVPTNQNQEERCRGMLRGIFDKYITILDHYL